MRVFILSIFILLGFQLSAQSKVKGQVVTTDGSAATFATVALADPSTKETIKAVNTDLDGLFDLEVAVDAFVIVVTYVGFQEYETGVIERESDIIDLGTIELKADTEVLDEVLVVGEKSSTEFKLDKRVFNPGKDLSVRGGTALNVLENVPSVQVDVEGNVSLRGNANVRILVNGRPNGLVGDGGQGLKALTSDMIAQIEVVTNPSARYEAEGAAGIINIILKKDQKKGFNGSFDLNASWPKSYGAAANLNYRSGKLNWFTNYGVNYRTRIGSSHLRQEIYTNDTTLLTQQKGERNRAGLSHNFRVGADYYFNEKTTLTLAGRYNLGDDDNISTTTYLDYINDDFTEKTVRTDTEHEAEEEAEISLSFRKEYPEKGHLLTADIRYQDEIETEGSDLKNRLFTSPEGEDGILSLVQRSANTERNANLVFQTDYVQPFGEEGKFEAGGRIGIRDITNDFKVEQLNNDVYEVLSGLTNEFFYDENIYAIYLMYGNKTGKLSYQLGLRPEYTDVTTKLLTTNEENARDYWNVFPSANLGFEFSPGSTLQFSYSRRVTRPRFWDLNPFFTFTDNRNFWSGNPDLDPEFSNNLELGLLRILDKGSLFGAFYFRNTRGVIQRIQRFNQDGTSVTKPENLATSQSYGIELNANYRFFSWMKFNTDINFYQEEISGGTDFPELNANTFAWFTRGTTQFDISKSLEGQLRFNYRSPQNTTQGRNLGIFSVDVALSQEILRKKGTLTFSVRDIFNSRRRRYIREGQGFYRKGDFQWQGTLVNLGLNYRLNQPKKRTGRRG